jgi:uncharacterized membrane protein
VDHSTAWFKVALAWVLTVIGGVTLSQIATFLAIVLTIVTIYKHVHDMRRQARLDAAAEANAAAKKTIHNNQGDHS